MVQSGLPYILRHFRCSSLPLPLGLGSFLVFFRPFRPSFFPFPSPLSRRLSGKREAGTLFSFFFQPGSPRLLAFLRLPLPHMGPHTFRVPFLRPLVLSFHPFPIALLQSFKAQGQEMTKSTAVHTPLKVSPKKPWAMTKPNIFQSNWRRYMK